MYVKVGGFAIPQLGHRLETREKPAGSEEVAALFKEMCLWTIETFGAVIMQRLKTLRLARLVCMCGRAPCGRLSTSAAACMLRLAHCSRLHCGNGRSMLQGNLFVDKVSMSYTVLWNAYKRITNEAGFSESDRALLFSGTAKKVYKL